MMPPGRPSDFIPARITECARARAHATKPRARPRFVRVRVVADGITPLKLRYIARAYCRASVQASVKRYECFIGMASRENNSARSEMSVIPRVHASIAAVLIRDFSQRHTVRHSQPEALNIREFFPAIYAETIARHDGRCSTAISYGVNGVNNISRV